ncbi:CU044_5270 family protein [Actinomadura litoris]|uniref:CU044_5270 family protein n=1 Tax=Actinomadura litoris TaxID=2678616 RepID=UPI001FA762A4|nr:CU044_5270 family protein [Actinomadura litoris]
MNLTPRQSPSPAERGELAGLLPAAGAPELSDGRRRILKEHFMLEIQESEPATAPRPAARRRRLAVGVLAATVAAGAAAAGAAVVADGGGEPEKAPPVALGGDAPADAVALLDRVSLAAAHKPAVAVRDDQFIYTRTKGAYGAIGSGPAKGKAGAQNQVTDETWTSPLPKVDGLGRKNGGRPFMIHGENVYSYKRLSRFPTDPDAILRRVYSEHKERKGYDQSKEGLAFDEIGRLVNGSLVPPRLAAGLYRAAAMIPGVVLVPDAVDAAGRHGMAVARVRGPERSEWIFDRKTYAYLGERSVLVEDGDAGKKGTVVSHSALLAVGVVDKRGRLPR